MYISRIHISGCIFGPGNLTGVRKSIHQSWLAKGLGLGLLCYWLFPKLLRGGRYETIEEMKEAVTKVIDTVTQEDFHGAFEKLLEW